MESSTDEISIEELVDMFCASLLEKVVAAEEERRRSEERELADFVQSLLDRVIEAEKERERSIDNTLSGFARVLCDRIVREAIEEERQCKLAEEEHRRAMEEEQNRAAEEEQRSREDRRLREFARSYCEGIVLKAAEEERQRRTMEEELRKADEEHRRAAEERRRASEEDRVRAAEEGRRILQEQRHRDMVKVYCEGIIQTAVERERRRKEIDKNVSKEIRPTEIRTDKEYGDYSSPDRTLLEATLPTTPNGDTSDIQEGIPKGLGAQVTVEKKVSLLESGDKHTQSEACEDKKGQKKPKKWFFALKIGRKTGTFKPFIDKALAGLVPVSTLVVPQVSRHVTSTATPTDNKTLFSNNPRLVINQDSREDGYITDARMGMDIAQEAVNVERTEGLGEKETNDLEANGVPDKHEERKRGLKWAGKVKRWLWRAVRCGTRCGGGSAKN